MHLDNKVELQDEYEYFRITIITNHSYLLLMMISRIYLLIKIDMFNFVVPE
jgi:hypothetical protein